MVHISHIFTLILLSTGVLAEYLIDNADPSIIYSTPPSQSGQSWQTFSAGSQNQQIQVSNSTGNYTVILDPSRCYDQNYAQATCGTDDNCFFQIPFTGSGITVFVFNAGTAGMTASFSVDGGPGLPRTIQAPKAAENYQASNVSLHIVEDLVSGNHTVKVTLMDVDGTDSATVMKFDYVRVNETLVEGPITSSSTPSTAQGSTGQTSVQTATASDRLDVESIVGITLGSIAAFGGIVIAIAWFFKRRVPRRGSFTSNYSAQIELLGLKHPSSTTSSSQSYHTQHGSQSLFSLRSDGQPPIPPLMRSAILRDALVAVGPSLAQSINSRSTSLYQSQVHHSPRVDSGLLPPLNISHAAEEGSSELSDPIIASPLDLTPETVEVVRGQLANSGLSNNMIMAAINALLSRLPTGNLSVGTTPPPSYQTRLGAFQDTT